MLIIFNIARFVEARYLVREPFAPGYSSPDPSASELSLAPPSPNTADSSLSSLVNAQASNNFDYAHGANARAGSATGTEVLRADSHNFVVQQSSQLSTTHPVVMTWAGRNSVSSGIGVPAQTVPADLPPSYVVTSSYCRCLTLD
jgi:hypothetical protein